MSVRRRVAKAWSLVDGDAIRHTGGVDYPSQSSDLTMLCWARVGEGVSWVTAKKLRPTGGCGRIELAELVSSPGFDASSSEQVLLFEKQFCNEDCINAGRDYAEALRRDY